MKHPRIILISGFLVGLGSGFVISRNIKNSGDSDEVDQSVRYRRESEFTDHGYVVSTLPHSKSRDRPNTIAEYDEISRKFVGISRILARADYYNRLSVEQLKSEIPRIQGYNIHEHRMERRLLFGSWVKQDPHSAMAYAISLGQSESHILHIVTRCWASTDPEEAARYIDQNKLFQSGWGANSCNAPGTIAEEWVKQDVEKAREWATGRKDFALRDLLEELARLEPSNSTQQPTNDIPKDGENLTPSSNTN